MKGHATRRGLAWLIAALTPWAFRAAASEAGLADRQSLSGDDWRVVSFEPGQGVERRAFAEGYPAAETVAATVPGDVHWDLERAGKVPPIYYGLNSQQIGWVAGQEWWYRKTFIPPAGWQGKTVRLRFEAVDYLTDVWLNGRLLGRHEGQFTPFEFDVTGLLRGGGENVLAVLIHPAPAAVRNAIATGAGEWAVMQSMRPAYPYWKCMTSAGWDWGAKIVTLGIWKDVRLIASEGVCLADPIVLPQLAPPYDRATLNIRLDLRVDQPRAATLNYRVRCLTAPDAPVVASQTRSLGAGDQRLTFSMEVPQPRLWWPNGYGQQHLYELDAAVQTADAARTLDHATATFGIRDLKMLQNPEAETEVEYIDYGTDSAVTHRLPRPPPERKYLIQINGRRVFARGGNWIPCDLLYGRPRQPAYEHLIRLAAQANFNLFRVWGGGLIDKPEFFDLCDRYGIMLFQEFPNGGVRLPETDAALAITGREVREILPLLMNHPSIVRYGGGNEWYRNATSSRQMAQLRKICNETDPTRPYHDPDPECIAQRHGPHGYEWAQHYRTYNTGLPLTAGPDNPLEWTEYGASGAASVQTLQRIMPAEHLWPIRPSDPYWTWHKAFGAYGADNWMASAQYLHLFGELPDLETTVRASQFVQAEGLRYANQSMRRFKWHRSACASWTYNEPWPNAAHGCVVEYYGRPKMAYYYTRNAYAPVDVSAEYPSLVCRTGVPFPLKLFVTSDRADRLKDCRLTAAVVDVRGREYDLKDWRLDLAPDATAAVGTWDLNPPDAAAGSVVLLHLQLRDSEGRDLSIQTYTFGVVSRDPADASAALQVPAVSPEGRRNLALLPGAKAAASSVLPGYAIHQVAHLNNGWYGNDSSWIEGERPSWAQVDLGAVHAISRVCVGNDHTRKFKDRGATEFRVLAAVESREEASAPAWQAVASYKGEALQGAKTFDFEPVKARWVRIDITGGAGTRLDEIEVYEAEPVPANQVAAAQAAAVRGPMPVTPEEAVPRRCLRPLLTAPATELELSVGLGPESNLSRASARIHRVTVRNRGRVPALFVALDLDAAEPMRYHVTDSGFTLLAGEARDLDLLEFPSTSPKTDATPTRLRAKAWNAAEVSRPMGTTNAASSGVLWLSGADWRIHEDPDGKGAERRLFEADTASPGWMAATVPGNIQADLEAAHRLTPLWYGAGDARMHEAACHDWWYCKDVAVPAAFAGRRVTLVFDGVDHECEVFLNSRKIGRNAGMYKRFWFDVSQAVRPGQVNRLAVRIARMPEELREAVLSADAPGGPNVGNASNAVRKRLKELKSPTNSAYDWAVAIYTLGIWKDVRLEATGPVRLDWVGVHSTLTDDYSNANLRVRLDLDSLTGLPVNLVVRATHGESLAQSTVTANLQAGTNHLEATLSLREPALWWPAGQGGQPLYELAVEVRSAATGELLDRRTTRFGIREIRWEQTPGTPADFINPLKLVVNGRPVRQMGSNLLPPDSLFGRMDARGPRLMELARAAGINCLRLWGGGVILSEAMYNRADELGILLLQEFPLANCMPETDPVFLANLDVTAVNIVKQVRNHPSIVEWSGGNEMPWQNGSDHPALRILEKAVREHDDRFLRATEPAQGSGPHGTYTYVYHTEPAGYLTWLGAGSQNLYRRYDTSVEMRISEFGTHSPANLEVWQRTIPPASQWPLADHSDPVLIRKNVFWGAVLKENWLHKEITERLFGPLAGLDQLVPAGQFLGAEGLRYAMDALRRKGPALGGGFMSWNYNEPWPNGAGSYMVDYDGRPLMNYDFVTQALTPVSLSLKYASLLYDFAEGVSAQLFLVSDAPEPARNLRWHWQARDRRGKVFAQGNGVTDSIEPQGVIPLESLALRLPAETALGPVFVELGLDDAQGRTLVERLHVFGATALQGPLAGLLPKGLHDRDDAGAEVPGPRSPQNLAWVGNGAAPATASAELPGFEIHRAKGLNDGVYGNAQSWIGGVAGASFQIELGQAAEVGVFRLGRDRTGGFADRTLGELKIETSADGQAWKTVFERQNLSALPGYRPTATMEIRVAPVRAKWVRAIVNPADVCLDEFEIYAPAAASGGDLPRILFDGGLPPRPVARTTIEVEARPVRIEGEQEVLDLAVRNAGPMTALFCEARPLIEYRTDLFIRNNHVSIPPGEARTLSIRSAAHPAGGLRLAQTGWRIHAWNADERVIEPAPSVLLALGRRDAMCREFLGYSNSRDADAVKQVTLEGTRPDPSKLPCVLHGRNLVRFEFRLSDGQAKHPARLRIHTADQAEQVPTQVGVTINGRNRAETLPAGLGIQRADPAHLAFPATAKFQIPATDLRPGKNTIEVGVQGDGWFSWDAMDLTGVSDPNNQVEKHHPPE